MPYYEYLTSIPYLQRPVCWLNLHSAPELSSSFHPQEERSIILKLLFRLTDCDITPNKTCVLQNPSQHTTITTTPWIIRHLALKRLISTLYRHNFNPHGRSYPSKGWQLSHLSLRHLSRTSLARVILASILICFDKKFFVTTEFCSAFFTLFLRLP